MVPFYRRGEISGGNFDILIVIILAMFGLGGAAVGAAIGFIVKRTRTWTIRGAIIGAAMSLGGLVLFAFAAYG
jgi:hypothetical protein